MDLRDVKDTAYPLLPPFSDLRKTAGQAKAQYDRGVMFVVSSEGGQPQPQWQLPLTLVLVPQCCSIFTF